MNVRAMQFSNYSVKEKNFPEGYWMKLMQLYSKVYISEF